MITETTSLATTAWLDIDSGEFGENIDLAVSYIIQQAKDGGRYGSTQATVLSLQALVRYSQVFGGVRGSGNFVMYANDSKIHSIPFDETQGIGKLDFSKKVNEFYSKASCLGHLTLNLKIEDYKYNKNNEGFHLSYLVQVDYKDTLPPTSPNALIDFDLSDSGSVSKVGQSQVQNIKLVNKSTKAQGMAIAQISVPSCMSVEISQLELLK